MRGKKAKAFRRQARAASIGMPERQLLAKMHKKIVVLDGKAETSGVLLAYNDPKSMRGIYRALKKGKKAT